MKSASRHNGKMPGMHDLVNQKDWSQTPLGPQKEWPESFNSLVRLLLDHPFPSKLLWGPDLIQIYNDGYRKIAANKHPEVLGRPTRQSCPEVWDSHQPIYKKVLEEGESIILEDQLYPVCRDEFEEEAYFTLCYSPARNEGGDVAGIFLTIFETTEQKEIEQKLRESKSRLDAFVTATSEVMYRMSPDWSEMYYLDGRKFIVDTDKPRKTWLEEYIPAVEQPRFMEAIKEAIKTKSMFNLEHQVVRVDGTLGWTYSRAIPILSEEGDITEWFGTATDITERKQREVDLRETTEKLELATTAGEVGLWTRDMKTDKVYGDTFMAKVYGMDPETVANGVSIEEFFTSIHEDDRDRVWEAIHRAEDETDEIVIEYRVQDIQGNWHWAEARAKMEYNDQGQQVRFNGTVIDITERKKREQRDQFLLELSDKVRTLTNQQEVGAVCTKLLAEELGLHRAYLVRFDPEVEEALVTSEYHSPSVEPLSGLYPYSSFPKTIQKLVTEKLVYNDVISDSTLPDEEKQDLLELNIRGWVGIPIWTEAEEADWAMCVAYREPHTWTRAEIMLIEETAERTWAAVKRAETEQELRESEERLKMAQDTAQLGSWELDVDSQFFTCSPICKAHFGRAPQDSFTYEDIIESIHPDDWEVKKKIMQEALDDGNEYEVEYRIYWPDGTQRWIYTRARPLSETRLSGVTLDITERKEIEEELEQRTRAVQTSRMKLRALVNELSHAEENQRFILAGELHDNLGQLLEVSKMKFDLLMKNNTENIPEAVHEIRDLINESIKCTRRLVNDLKPTPAEEKENLDSALKWVAGKMEKHGLVVHIENGQEHKPMALGSLNTLVQVVQELLFNVVKHAEAEQAWISVNRSDQFVQIKVEDEGEGFDPKKHEESTGQEGFGLFNVRQRIDLMGGTFNIESKPGEGTSAFLQIPLKSVDTFDRNLKPGKTARDNGPVSSQNHALISVLVVDDHQMMREGIAGIINTENDMFVADEASTGEEAIPMVGEVKPDVVIMDLNLPGINGIEATKKIKADYPQIKVIGISFRNDQTLVNKVLNAGASDFVGKDETMQSICQAIREAVS